MKLKSEIINNINVDFEIDKSEYIISNGIKQFKYKYWINYPNERQWAIVNSSNKENIIKNLKKKIPIVDNSIPNSKTVKFKVKVMNLNDVVEKLKYIGTKHTIREEGDWYYFSIKSATSNSKLNQIELTNKLGNSIIFIK